MTSKKDPPPKPGAGSTPTQSDPLAGQPLEVVLEVLATAGGKMEGKEGAALKRHVAHALAEAQRVVADVEQKASEEEQRKAAAAEITSLVDILIRSGTPIATELQKNRGPIVNAFRAADLQTLAAGLTQLAAMMTNPSEQTDKQAKALLAQLEQSLGPAFGIDPDAAENARREQMKADVKKSLDEAFRGKDFAATLKKKPE